MGMRATIAVINKDNTVYRTSVQWSTILDRNLGVLAHRARENGEDMLKVVFNALYTVVKEWEHIGAFDQGYDKETLVKYPHWAEQETPIVHGMVVKSGSKRDYANETLQEMAQRDEIEKNVKIGAAKKKSYDFHLDGGSVGVVLSEKEFFRTGKLELFYEDNRTQELKVSKVSVESLANFYKDGNRKDNRKFGFRL